MSEVPQSEAPHPEPLRSPYPQSKSNTLALIAFVLSLVAISLPAAICGHVALSQIDSSGRAAENRWMAIAAIVIGWIGVAVYLLIIVSSLAASSSTYSY